MGCLKLYIESEPLLRLAYSKKGQKAQKNRGSYYPFGLKQKGYNTDISPSANALAQQWKYNGVELNESLGLNLYEMDFRQYDPTIGRFTGIDPVVHHSMSTYTAFDNNPAFWADPSGADATYSGQDAQNYFARLKNYIASKSKEDEEEEDENDDKITVNSEGVITNVEREDAKNRFFDECGNELFFHDPEGVDKPYVNSRYSIGDKLFYFISIEEINNEIISNGLIMQRYLSNTSNPAGAGYYIWSLLSARGKSQGGFDFAEGYLVSFINYPGRNDTKGWANYNDDAGFFRLGNSNNIYNLYDAGNYMWGRAMGMSGFSYGEIRVGSQLNERFGDSEADQRAIKKGFNGN